MTYRQYKRAMGIIARLVNLDPHRNTTEGSTLRLLVELCNAYELAQSWCIFEDKKDARI